MTYKQAYDKIIDAYFKDEIQPYSGQFCFCGTLCGFIQYGDNQPNYHGWPTVDYNEFDLGLMENALLSTINKVVGGNGSNYCPFEGDHDRVLVSSHHLYEDALFAGMCAALEVLKQIHIDRGEVIDHLPTFTKRVFSDHIKVKI